MAADLVSQYAQGFLALARAEEQVERVESELSAVGRAVETSSELRSTLTDPQLPLERKQALLDELIGSRASSLTTNIVQLVVAQGHGADLPDIASAFLEASAASRDKAVAEVRSAVPLDDETKRRLTVALGEATGKDVEINAIVDPSVMGGIVARVGDTVIDGSVARRIDSLRSKLANA